MTEAHPFQPFMPEGAKLLMLGTFPPSEKRWCMPFYYPNFQNDMWRIVGLCFFSDKQYFVIPDEKRFDQQRIEAFLRDKGIAIFDTAQRVVRTKNTASDKDLQIVEPSDIAHLLQQLPECQAVVTAGQLATQVFASRFGTNEPQVGAYVEFMFAGRTLRHYRMPSSSRAYPMSVERKAAAYQTMFDDIFGKN